jgi:hypothetical protein
LYLAVLVVVIVVVDCEVGRVGRSVVSFVVVVVVDDDDDDYFVWSWECACCYSVLEGSTKVLPVTSRSATQSTGRQSSFAIIIEKFPYSLSCTSSSVLKYKYR